MIDAGISAAGCNGEPAQVMRPAPIMACALRLVGKAAMGHAQQRAAVALDQIDLDQARSRRHLLATLPAEGVDETVDRHDLSKRATRNPGVAADAFEEVKSARMCFRRRLAAIQLTIFSGSVRKAKTVAGGAAIWVSRRTRSGSFIDVS